VVPICELYPCELVYRAPPVDSKHRQDPLDISLISTPSPDFSRALGVRYPNPPSSETPGNIRTCVARLRHIADRREKLVLGLTVLHEMLYLAECPEDFHTIANLIGEVRTELYELGG
jgi:hypothetical protein